MALPSLASFGAMLALTVLSSVVYTPASILADAAVMAASTHVSASSARTTGPQRAVHAVL